MGAVYKKTVALVLSLVLAVFGIFALCGCAKESQTPEDGEGEEIFVMAGKSKTFKLPNGGTTKGFSFEYKAWGGGEFGLAFIGDDWGVNYYGYYYFDEDGDIAGYPGITVTDLTDGFKKVNIDLSKTNITTGNKKPETVKIMYLRGDYSHVDVTIRNIKIVK